MATAIAKKARKATPAANAEIFTITTPKLAKGERWRGVVLGADGRPSHNLVLVAVSENRLTHQEAIDWAKKLGADLAEKNEGALLFANNADGAVPQEWVWLKTLHAGSASYAWCQDFDNGGQIWGYRNTHCRAVAVRRYPVQ